MRNNLLALILMGVILLWGIPAAAQNVSSPITGAKLVKIDEVNTGGSTSYGYRGENIGFQDCIFYEPLSGNMVTTWYDFYSGDANPRRIAAATSLDAGDSWTIFRDINAGLPNSTAMSGYYPIAWGTMTSPILVWDDISNTDQTHLQRIPTVAQDYAGWGVGGWGATYVDEKVQADTIVDYRNVDFVTSPDNPMNWIVSAWHSSTASDLPGEFYAVWQSADGGFTWSRPKNVMSSIAADSLQPNYVYNIMSSGLLLDAGMGGKVFAAGEAQDMSGSLWWTYYATSADYGATWVGPMMVPPLAGWDNDFNRTDRNKSSVVDLAGNWHLFVVVVDSSDTTYTRYVYDAIYDGAAWTAKQVAAPQLLYNGLTYNASQIWLHDPAIDASGTIYYTYMDIPDTTGGLTYGTYVTFSEDNGQTWKGPVKILDGFYSTGWTQGWSGMARVASDYLHICLSGYENDPASPSYQSNVLWYFGVPTAEIKLAVSVRDRIPNATPDSYELFQNFPNPFNPNTTIKFDLKEQTHVTLKIYNELGQEVATLIDKTLPAGHKGVSWNASGFPSGVYFYKLSAGDFTETRKMVLAK